MKVGLVQMRSGMSPQKNLADLEKMISELAKAGAQYIQTPEMTNMLVRDRKALFETIRHEEDDLFLARSCEMAKELGIWLHLGSIAVLHEVERDKAVNRAFLIDPQGKIIARYDKIHMFDVDIGEGNRWQESATYKAGDNSCVVDLGEMNLALAICYDVRFPALARSQAQAGANVLSFPAAFTKVSGEAHWHALLRARAIENGAFIVAAAQGGKHEDGRETFGHSLVYSPWGELLGEIDNDEAGTLMVELDMELPAKVRKKIPSLTHDRVFVVTAASSQ